VNAGFTSIKYLTIPTGRRFCLPDRINNYYLLVEKYCKYFKEVTFFHPWRRYQNFSVRNLELFSG
jgi:hypothetical protein